MTKDPVCGMQVDEKSSASTSSYQGHKHAFCSKECKDKFDKNPERYVRAKVAMRPEFDSKEKTTR